MAGIYGMNFVNLPGMGTTWGYLVVLGVMGSACAVLYWRFRSLGWLRPSRRTVPATHVVPRAEGDGSWWEKRRNAVQASQAMCWVRTWRSFGAAPRLIRARVPYCHPPEKGVVRESVESGKSVAMNVG